VIREKAMRKVFQRALYALQRFLYIVIAGYPNEVTEDYEEVISVLVSQAWFRAIAYFLVCGGFAADSVFVYYVSPERTLWSVAQQATLDVLTVTLSTVSVMFVVFASVIAVLMIVFGLDQGIRRLLGDKKVDNFSSF
jgi:hypothetical protein